MKSCDNCKRVGECGLEKDARAILTTPLCGFWVEPKGIQLEFDYEYSHIEKR